MKTILVIDDDKSICETLALHLGGAMKVHTANTGREGLAIFENESPDLVILDIRLPDMDGLDALEKIRKAGDGAYVIMVTAYHDMESTIEAIHKGAFDYIPKPINLDGLDLSIKKAFENIRLHGRLRDLAAEVNEVYKVDTLVGKSPAMEEVFKTIGVASQGKVTTLIQGESGTGKELIARAIHHNSEERDHPFMAINCSVLVDTLLESELFGHEKGSFTGAVCRKQGKFEVADGGTVFLDEIGETSPAMQVKLLRFLQERQFERVGGNVPIKTDIRVIAATNKRLEDLVAEGLFREDLFYRLKVMTIDAPPLRERREDISLLTNHLLEKANRNLHKAVRKIPHEVLDSLMNYPWPGNVRELENVITSGVLLATGDVLADVYLPEQGSKSNGRDRTLIEHSPTAVYLFDEKMNFIDTNPAGVELLGYSRDELLSMSIPQVYADPEAVKPAHEQLERGEPLINYEHRLRRKDGSAITVLNNSIALKDLNGRVTNWCSFLMDITGRKGTYGASPSSLKLKKLDDVEKEHIRKILRHTKWNKSKASRILEIPLPRLDRKIKKYNLSP